jgi:hypothetical protein
MIQEHANLIGYLAALKVDERATLPFLAKIPAAATLGVEEGDGLSTIQQPPAQSNLAILKKQKSRLEIQTV